VDPAAGCDTISFVLNLSRVILIEIFKQGFLKKVWVECSDTIYSVGAHDCKVRHANLLILAFLDDTHTANPLSLVRVPLLKFLDVEVIH